MTTFGTGSTKRLTNGKPKSNLPVFRKKNEGNNRLSKVKKIEPEGFENDASNPFDSYNVVKPVKTQVIATPGRPLKSAMKSSMKPSTVKTVLFAPDSKPCPEVTATPKEAEPNQVNLLFDSINRKSKPNLSAFSKARRVVKKVPGTPTASSQFQEQKGKPPGRSPLTPWNRIQNIPGDSANKVAYRLGMLLLESQRAQDKASDES